MDTVIEKYCLKNALDHQGKANVKAVFSKIVIEIPEAKKNVKKWMKKVEQVVKKINRLSLVEQTEKLEELAPELLIKHVEKKKELELPNVKGRVIMRYAPNPNAGMHIGNARAALLNDYFVKKYGGTFILRYDDTDPKNEKKKPNKQAYKQIKKDLEWLGVKIGRVEYASKRLKRYYEVFDQLLKKNKAYVCTCDPESWRERKRNGIACPCRYQSIYENRRKWKMMLFGDYKEGQAVARIKTNIKYKDPAQRDWACFRIVDKPNHPITRNKFIVWPLLDFASAVDDYDHKTTHILRGQDLKISELRQKWLYNYMHWTYPITITYGHLGFETGSTFSKSQMREGISSGKYSGWDDPQLPMLASYKRRGFMPEAIRQIILDQGITGGKINLSEDALIAANKSLIDFITPRYNFVPNPHRVELKNVPVKNVTFHNHPTNKDLGVRTITISKYAYISGDDVKNLRRGVVVRLKDFGNFKVITKKVLKYYSNQDILKNISKIQWVSGKPAKVEVLMPNGDKVSGYGESVLKKMKLGKLCQFVRFGFVRKDSNKPLTFVFGHK